MKMHHPCQANPRMQTPQAQTSHIVLAFDGNDPILTQGSNYTYCILTAAKSCQPIFGDWQSDIFVHRMTKT